jgi:HK97 gp10 family phage protein
MATRVVMNPGGVAAVHAEANALGPRAAELMAEDMRRYVPVETGDLVATIRVEPGSPVTRIVIGDVAGGVDYHLYQEFGTSVMDAQPYIRPAVFQYRGSL